MKTLIFEKTGLKTEEEFIKNGKVCDYYITLDNSVIVKYLGVNNKIEYKSVELSHDKQINKNYMKALFKASNINIQFKGERK